jgi:hypothetical protein
MEQNFMETETLALLYLKQGLAERALPIFEQVLIKDPNRQSALAGIEKCKAILAQEQKSAMDKSKRLQILKILLSRLTGEDAGLEQATLAQAQPAKEYSTPVIEPVSKPVEAPPVAVKDYAQRKLELLQTMLRRLTG